MHTQVAVPAFVPTLSQTRIKSSQANAQSLGPFRTNSLHPSSLLWFSLRPTPWTLRSDEAVLPFPRASLRPQPPALSSSQRLVFAPWPHWGHGPSTPALPPFNLFPARHIDFLIKWHPSPEPGLRNAGLAELKIACSSVGRGVGLCLPFPPCEQSPGRPPRTVSARRRAGTRTCGDPLSLASGAHAPPSTPAGDSLGPMVLGSVCPAGSSASISSPALPLELTYTFSLTRFLHVLWPLPDLPAFSPSLMSPEADL